MNDYQRSLEGFNEPSITDDQIQQTVEESAPVEGPQTEALHVERDSEGELQPVYESPETQPVQQQLTAANRKCWYQDVTFSLAGIFESHND